MVKSFIPFLRQNELNSPEVKGVSLSETKNSKSCENSS